MSIRDTDLWKSETYYVYYLENIHTILQRKEFGYIWETIEDCEFTYINASNWNFENPFFQCLGEDKLVLAEDILNRGTYATIAVKFRGINSDGRKCYHILSGSHRVFVLKQLSMLKNLGRRFLFIYSLIEDRAELDEPILLYGVEKDNDGIKLKLIPVYTFYQCREVMDRLISGLNWYFKEENVLPSKILNDEIAFNRFMIEGTLL